MKIEITLHRPGGSPAFINRTYESARGYAINGGFLLVEDGDGVIRLWPERQIFEVVVVPAPKRPAPWMTATKEVGR